MQKYSKRLIPNFQKTLINILNSKGNLPVYENFALVIIE